MNQGYLMHRAYGSDCYALDREHLVITIKTGYEVTAVELVCGDPFSAGIMGGAEHWEGDARISMERDGRLQDKQLWAAVVTPEYKRCKYYFVVHAGEETCYLLEDGCYTEKQLQMPEKKLQLFYFPWINPSDVAETPDWVADTIWYQIFPERFCNGNVDNDPVGTKPWKCEKTQYYDYYGGDLQGICDKIPYLKDLGITGIYLTPVFAADSNHKYNTLDYYRIDESFGTEEVLKEMVKKAHEAGIRVMLDAVFNHSGSQFAPWKDVQEKGSASEYFDWFFVNEWPFPKELHNTRNGEYYSFAFSEKMPKLNTNNPNVADYFTKLCSYWLKEWDIDGIRFDVGNEVAHSFLKHLRRELKKIKPKVYLLGEIWHDSMPWLQGDEYDSVMNYPFSQSINDFFVDLSMTAENFEYRINRCYHLYYRQINRVLFNLLDSHDTERLIYRIGGDMGKFYQQLALLFTMEGSPCIYYGTEIAMEGGYDPDCRRCMPWDEIESGRFDETRAQVKRLIAIRKKYKAAASEKILWKKAENERVIWYEKIGEKEKIGVIINAAAEDISVEIQGTVLFSYSYDGQGKLLPSGVLIYLSY